MTIYAGLNELKITPSSSVYLAGYAARNTPSNGIHDELYAKCLYLEKDREKVVLVSLDLVGLPLEIVNKIRLQIKKKLGFENIIITCTHTHSGPNTISFLNTEIDNNWLKLLTKKVVDVIVDATKKKTVAKIGVTKTDVHGIGKNRRGNKDIVDPELGIIKVVDLKGETKAIIINFTCHPTVLDANNMLISADYPAYIYKYLSEHYPEAVIMFTNGAAGDINIGYSADDSALGEVMNIRTYENADRIGKLITQKLLEVSDQIDCNDTSLKYRRVKISFPIKKEFPTLKELKNKLVNTEKRISLAASHDEKKKLQIKKIYDEILLSKIKVLKGKKELVSEVDFLYLEQTILITIPGELFCRLGLELKGLFPGKKVFIIGYANDYISYIPTKEAFNQGGYEVETSIFTEEIGQILINKIKSEA
jgi:hypothetical protein